MKADADSGVISLTRDVQYHPAWLTWVASTTTCFRAVGIECDQADVAGFSGYAFHVCVHEALCPSAPTTLDWAQLSRGAHALGRATVEFRAPHGEASGAARDEACRGAYELVRRELLAQARDAEARAMSALVEITNIRVPAARRADESP